MARTLLCLWLLSFAAGTNVQMDIRSTPPRLPVVVTLAVPFYPPIARAAGVEGAAVLKVSTDGGAVSAVLPAQGVPMLVAAAEENVKTWRFKPHQPATFFVTYKFELVGPYEMVFSRAELDENPTILFKLPSEIRVTTTRKGLGTVDRRR